jgi:hypothetical protein
MIHKRLLSCTLQALLLLPLPCTLTRQALPLLLMTKHAGTATRLLPSYPVLSHSKPDSRWPAAQRRKARREVRMARRDVEALHERKRASQGQDGSRRHVLGSDLWAPLSLFKTSSADTER